MHEIIILSMKRTIIAFALLVMTSSLVCSQVIDNKGNRLQSYPWVTEADADVMSMVEQVDTANLYQHIEWMQQFVRDASSPAALETQNWLIDKFEALGLETTVHSFPNPIGGTNMLDAGNVVAVQYGTTYPDEIVIVSSHYDHPDGPGADDNASGTAGVLECARILSQYEFERTIYYVPFNAEEYWMVGSFPFAERCAAEDLNILGVFNMDMIGWWPAEMGEPVMYSGYSAISKPLFEYYQRVADIYNPTMPTLRFSDGDSYGGDHMPFNMYEYPALYIGDIEYHHLHPCYHQPCDTIGHGVNNFALARGFVRSVVAAVAELANGWLPPQDLSALPGSESVSLSWRQVTGAAGYRLYRDDELLAELTDTSYVDSALEPSRWYSYHVVAVDAEGHSTGPSNADRACLLSPLDLPYHNDMENGLDGLIFPYDSWIITSSGGSGSHAITNHTSGVVPDDYISVVELPWFSLADTVRNVTLSYRFKGTLRAIWRNTAFFVEVTTDRKTWHKIDKITIGEYQWQERTLSLDAYIGEPYVQLRFRIESSGSSQWLYLKNVFLDDVSITYEASTAVNGQQYDSFNLSICPNPACHEMSVRTGLEGCYSLSVFTIHGVMVMHHDSFSDGILDISTLPSGAYMIRVDSEGISLAKKFLVQ